MALVQDRRGEVPGVSSSAPGLRSEATAPGHGLPGAPDASALEGRAFGRTGRSRLRRQGRGAPWPDPRRYCRHDPAVAAEFPTDDIFRALRLDAYLLAAGRKRPEAAKALEAIVERTAATRLALVHGDVSPKNILLGAEGPVFLDAETAWWGDPAFDLAFCLNHLLLKRLLVTEAPAKP